MLMTSNPGRSSTASLQAGIEIADRMPLEAPINADNRRYMTAKAARAGHQLGHLIAALGERPEAQVAELTP